MSYLASDDLQGRNTGTDGIELAATYIEDYFKDNNIAPYYTTYKDTFDAEGKEAYNIVGVVPGNDASLKNEIVLLGAHYDHIGAGKKVNNDLIANGANDNAAGTAAVLAFDALSLLNLS